MLTIIYGPSGSGKTYSTRNIDNGCLYIDPLGKMHNTMNCDRMQLPVRYEAIARYMSESQKDTIVIDDASILIYDELNMRSDEKGYDKYSDIAGSFYKLLKFARQQNKHIVLMMPWQVDSFGFESISTGGMLISEKLPISMMSDNIYKTTIKDGDYVFVVKNTGNDMTKDGLQHDGDGLTYIDADLQKVIERAREMMSSDPVDPIVSEEPQKVRQEPTPAQTTTRERRVRR